MRLEKISVAIDARHASRLSAIRKKNARAVAEYAWELREKGVAPDKARLAARRETREQWPPVSVLVARAIEQRLDEEDLAGPWAALGPDEEDFMTLSGRWPSKNYGGPLVKRAYDLPSVLVKRLRTTAYRVSEQPLAELEELGLTLNRLDLTEEQRKQRDELVARVYPVPRIVREALERYAPWAREDTPGPSSPADHSKNLLRKDLECAGE